MPKFNVIYLAYGVMIVGMMFCFVLSRRRKKDIRKECDGFVFPFVSLSNYVCPNTLAEELAVETTEEGAVRALPLERQPEAIRFVAKRANADKSVKLFAQMVSAADRVTKAAGVNRTQKLQFSEPINEILTMTHTFLEGCEDMRTIDSMEKKRAFDSFTREQVQHRMMLLKRISGAASDDYRKQNHNYAAEMEAIERAEDEARRNRNAPKAKK